MEAVGGLMGPNPLDATQKKKKVYIYTHIQLGPRKEIELATLLPKAWPPPQN